MRSRRLRAFRHRLAVFVHALDRGRIGSGRYFVTGHRTLRTAVPEEERIEGLLLRNSQGSPAWDMLSWDATLVPGPTVDHVAHLFRFEGRDLSPEERTQAVALHAIVAASLQQNPDLVFYTASWILGDVAGAEGTGFAICDRRTGEVLWVRRTESAEGEGGSAWNTIADARLVTDVERREWRSMVEALPRPVRTRVYMELDRAWQSGPVDDRIGYLASVAAQAISFRGRTEAENAAFARGAVIMLAGCVGEVAEETRARGPAATDRLLATLRTMRLREPAEPTRQLLMREARLALGMTQK